MKCKASESKVLSVRLLSGLSTKQPETKKAMEMQAEAEHLRSDGNPQNEINFNRSTSAQEINKHVSVPTSIPMRTNAFFEAKDFSKSEAELVDVKDTHQT